jgi:hypothetical protein
MKRYLVILCVSIFVACHNSNNNVSQKAKIDKIPFSECNIILEVDSIGNQIDTASIEMFKFDQGKKKVFKFKEYKYNDETYWNSTYLWTDGTDFLSIIKSNLDDFYSYSETFRNKSDKVERMITIEKYDDKLDTMNLIFSHSANITTIRSTKLSDQSETILKYNDDRKIVEEITMLGSDTFSISKYTYLKTKMHSKITTKYGGEDKLRIEYKYDEFGNLKSEIELGLNHRQDSISNEISYIYDNKDELIGFSESNLISKRNRYYKVIRKTCD